VWQGGFLDCAQHWHSKGQPRAELLGRVIWKVDSASAIRVIGDDGASPSPSFRGYDLVNGEPRFSYRLGATLVSETLSGDPGTGGLRRTFVIENPGAPVWLEMPETAGFRREASAGIWEKEGLRVPEAEAGHFDVLLTAEEASGEK
jgi:hypothetical protein